MRKSKYEHKSDRRRRDKPIRSRVHPTGLLKGMPTRRRPSETQPFHVDYTFWVRPVLYGHSATGSRRRTAV